MVSHRQLEVLWLTNIPTPYTVPVWRELSKVRSMKIACLAQIEPNRSWRVDCSGLDMEFLNAPRLRVGHERCIYGPSWRLQKLLSLRPKNVIIDGWESLAAIQSIGTTRLHGGKIILSYWSTGTTHRFTRGPIAAHRRRVFKYADAIFTPGTAATRAAISIGASPEKVVTGVAAIDVARFAEGAKHHKQKPTIDGGRRFLFVGQLIHRKNVAALIDAFATARGAHDTLTIVGDGPLRGELERRARVLAGDSIEFAGHRDMEGLIEAYGESDTLILPSMEEVWGLVVNEALVSGLSVIVSDQCGIAETIRDMPNVKIVSPDKTSIAEALQISCNGTRSNEHPHPIAEHTPWRMARIIETTLS